MSNRFIKGYGFRLGLVLCALVASLVIACGVAAADTLTPFTGQYYVLPQNHPDVEQPYTGNIITGLVEDELGGNGLPVLTSFGSTQIHQFDWYSGNPALTRDDNLCNLQTSGWFPLGTGRNSGYYFAVHWQATLVLDENETAYGFSIGSDDDAWVFIDGNLIMDVGGVHAYKSTTSAAVLSEGSHKIDVFFAQRHTVESGFSFCFSTNPPPPPDLESAPITDAEPSYFEQYI